MLSMARTKQVAAKATFIETMDCLRVATLPEGSLIVGFYRGKDFLFASRIRAGLEDRRNEGPGQPFHPPFRYET